MYVVPTLWELVFYVCTNDITLLCIAWYIKLTNQTEFHDIELNILSRDHMKATCGDFF